MAWQGVLEHDELVQRFRHAVTQGRLASSFLFCGPAGIGKRTFALKLAQALLCSQHAEQLLDPCQQCPSCQQVTAGSHPDLEIVGKPADKSTIPLELLIGDKEHRMREGLCHRISLRPFLGRRKIALIDDADHLNAEGANCLLKTLEEPPPRSVLILIGTSPARQLPTIRSRCQLVRFLPLSAATVAKLLVEKGLIPNADQARHLAEHSEGSLQRALEMADEALWAFRPELYRHLAEPLADSVAFSRAVSTLVDSAGREPAARRERFRQTVRLAAQFFRTVLRLQCGSGATSDEELGVWARRAVAARPASTWPTEQCLQRCLDAAEQIDRNANQSTLIETWLDDLAEIDRRTVVERTPRTGPSGRPPVR